MFNGIGSVPEFQKFQCTVDPLNVMPQTGQITGRYIKEDVRKTP